MTVSVYALFDGDSDEPRYVGMARDPALRLKRHLRDATKGVHTRKCDWLRSLGKRPRMQRFELPNREEAAERERQLIAYYRQIGCRLTNVLDGGQGTDATDHRVDAIRVAAVKQMADPDQRRLRRVAAAWQWLQRGDEMAAALRARGEEWRESSAAASRRLAATKRPCPHCGRLLSRLGGAAGSHIAVCARPVPPCVNCGEIGTRRRRHGRCHNCSEYYRLKGRERAVPADDCLKHGFVDEIV